MPVRRDRTLARPHRDGACSGPRPRQHPLLALAPDDRGGDRHGARDRPTGGRAAACAFACVEAPRAGTPCICHDSAGSLGTVWTHRYPKGTRIEAESQDWESTALESELEQASTEAATPTATTAAAAKANADTARRNIAADAETRRQRQALELQRERILSERTSSPHRRSALSAALLEIEEKLGELGWTLHL